MRAKNVQLTASLTLRRAIILTTVAVVVIIRPSSQRRSATLHSGYDELTLNDTLRNQTTTTTTTTMMMMMTRHCRHLDDAHHVTEAYETLSEPYTSVHTYTRCRTKQLTTIITRRHFYIDSFAALLAQHLRH